MARRTKILVTLGPATDAPGRLDELVAAGMDGGRINCAHDGPEQWARRAAGMRAAAQRAGRPLALVMDLAGPKMRLGATPEREVMRGERVTFAAGEDGADGAVPTAWPGLAEAVTVGRSEIVIGDGTPRLRVIDAHPAEGTVTAAVERPGRIGPRKGIYVTYVASPSSTLGRPRPRRPRGRLRAERRRRRALVRAIGRQTSVACAARSARSAARPA